MTKPDFSDEPVLREYLVGALGAQERSAFEDRYFNEEELFDRLDAAADDLCLDYVRGRLTVHERQRVEELARSADWQRRLEFAVAFHRQLAESPGVRGSSEGSVWASARDWMAAQTLVMRIALAVAGLLLLLGWPMALTEYWRGRAALEALQTKNSSQANASSADASAAGAQLNDQRIQLQELQQRLAKQVTVSFILVPGRTRDAGDRLVVPAEASFVRFQLVLERAPGASDYRAIVRTADGRTVGSPPRVEVAGAGSGRTIDVQMPAIALPTGEYELDLEGSNGQGRFDEVATYAFSVAHR